jgi:signal transduction histidine kinase
MIFNQKTIRGKLLLWFISTTTLTFLLLGAMVSLVIWRVLHDQIDHHLHTVITEARQVVTGFPVPERNDLLESFVMQQGMTVTILNPDGKPQLQTNSPDIAALSEQAMQQLLQNTPVNSHIPVHFNINQMRFATIPVVLPEGNGLLAIGYSLSIVEQTFGNIIAIIIIMLIVSLVLTTYGIRNLLSKHLQPLEAIADKTNLINHSGNLSLRIPTVTDTAELKTLSTSINNMLDRLENFFKTEHQFFSDTAHTLKTPMAIIRAYIDNSPDSREKDHLTNLVDQTNEIIADLILLSRMNSLEPVSRKNFSLTKLMTSLTEISDTLAEDKNLLVDSYIQPHINLYANEALIKRALSNLVHNSINYTPAQGGIKIELKRKADKAVITITDSGVGIPKRERSQIFKRFYRGSNVRKVKGTGLGLAISKAIITQSGGSIKIHSRLHHGTTVTVILPLAKKSVLDKTFAIASH